MDPLLLLRKYLPSGGVTLHDTDGGVVDELTSAAYIKLGPYIFGRDVATNFRSKRGAGDYYPLDAVYFMATRDTIGYGEYMQEARRQGVMPVSLVDKKDLLAYVREDGGRPEECPFVDTSAPLSTARRSFTGEEPVDEEEETMAVATTIAEQGGQRAQLATMGEVVPGMLPALTGASAPSISTGGLFITRPARSRNTPLMAQSKDFTSVLEIAKDVFATLERETAAPLAAPTSMAQPSLIEQIASANKPVPSSSEKRSLLREQSLNSGVPASTPIIIVPAAPSATLTMFNVASFLGDSATFVSSAEARARAKDKENVIFIEHRFKSAGTTMRFQIVDNPIRLTADQWSRVVAVFVQGTSWQFKGWRWETPAEILSRVKGYSLELDDGTGKLDSSWRVQRLVVSISRRHGDATAHFQFWSSLEEHLRQKRLL